MADMSALFSRAMPVSLVPGMAYLIMYAQKIQTENGMHLFVKLHAEPKNVFCKIPEGLAYLFSDSQIDQINNEKLFVNLSFWGRSRSGDPIIQIRNAALPMPAFHEMAVAGAFDI